MSVAAAPLILASASPRRSELLRRLGLSFDIEHADIDEERLGAERPDNYTLRLARGKAMAVQSRGHAGAAVLGADTAVVVDGEIFGKPMDANDARSMLRRLSNRTHEVYSAVALALPDGSMHTRLSISRVTFAPLDEHWISEYCASGEPLDKAGAYGIQGVAAEQVTRLEGSRSGVMGLPLEETRELLREAGLINGK